MKSIKNQKIKYFESENQNYHPTGNLNRGLFYSYCMKCKNICDQS